MTIIQGQKIVLRPYQDGDAEIILESSNNPTIRRLTATFATFTLEQTQQYVARFAHATDRVGFIIAHPTTLEALGEIVILNIDADSRSANIRVSLFYEADFNKGYGSEAMRLMVDYAFQTLKLHRLGLDVLSLNPRAFHVYEKVGFKREGILRDVLFYEGQYHDEIIMSILEHEWESRPIFAQPAAL
ncbi:MAG: GNAT family N-acetyltransferase [Chloroflexi bacterium]|nr:GNAT family N-acetyltransferase [Chloroflexota bacterium]